MKMFFGRTYQNIILSFVVMFMFLASKLSLAQENSWINYNQQYFKIQVVNEGIYRVSAADLINVGIPLSSIYAENMQIFHNGEEQYIYIGGIDASGKIGYDGYIEFYGQKNTGADEFDFYNSPENMINPNVSLYNDTAAYFFTWTTGTGNRRMVQSSDTDYESHIANSQAFCYREVRTDYKSKYYEGNTRSFITQSEGWMDSDAITVNGRNKTIATAQAYTEGPDAEIEFAVGSTNISNSSSFASYHQLSVSYQNQVYADTSYFGYDFARSRFNVPGNSLANNTTLNFKTNHAADEKKSVVSYINIKYPHKWNFENSSSFKFILPENQSDSKDYLEITNFSANGTAILYDLTNHKRIITTSGTEIKALVDGTDSERTLILVGAEGYLSPETIRKVSESNYFTNYLTNFPEADYLIVTHQKYLPECEEYAVYRNTTGYKALVADVAQLYDQYAYGVNRNPAAIRRFCNVVYEASPSQKFLFLVGRSLEANLFKNSAANATYTTVPSAGNPASDALFTVGLGGTTVEPLFATGRLAVTSAETITTYKNKVVEYENAEPARWMKEILHFGGGASANEQENIRNYLLEYESIIEDTLYGGNVHTFQKNTSAAVTTSNGDSINNLINNGVSIMTFFGHGSSTNFDHEILEPSAYTNVGRYPFMIGKSCYVGAIHTNTYTLSDEWVWATKGAIGFLASMDQGSLSYMDIYTTELYKCIGYKNYGSPIGVQILNTLKNVLDGNQNINLEITSYQETLHGDPGIVINSFLKPDLMIDNSSITLSPQEVTTLQDSFDVNINIRNLGKAITDSFEVFVTRRLPNGSDSLCTITVDGCIYENSLSVRIPTDIINGAGMNNLRIYVDGMAEIDELSETNNYVSLDFIIKSNDLFPIFPYEFAIYPNDTVTLVASPGDPFGERHLCRFQIDTTDRFNSPAMREAVVDNENGGVVRWKVPFGLDDNTVYYWRVSIDPENGEARSWKESSFIYIAGEEGWSQAHYFQFKKDKYNFIDYNPQTQIFTFSDIRRSLTCHVTAQGAYNDTYWSIDGVMLGNTGSYGGCNTGAAMVAIVIDPLTLEAWMSDRENYGHRNYPKCFSSTNPNPFFTFDLNATALAGMNWLLNDVPNGHYILVHTWRAVSYSVLPQELINTLRSLGATTDFGGMSNTTAYIFSTRKGTPSIHREVYGPTISMEPLPLTTSNDYGFIQSVVVGPSRGWEALKWNHVSEGDDEVKLEVYGITNAGDEVLVIDSIGASELDILQLENVVDYQIYPNLKLNLFARDTTEKTVPQLKKWQLRFEGVGETAIDPKLGYFFHTDTIERGDEIVFAIATQNISNYDMDSLTVKYWLRDSRNNETLIDIRTLRPHPAQDVIIDTMRYSTLGLLGMNSIWVEFNPINEETGTYYQPEQSHFNNIATKYFYVTTDNSNPLLEVSFDGKYIMNGEIVSAKPEILITLKDENKFLALNDTSLFEISLTNLNTGTSKPVHFGIQENPLETIEWIPAELPDNKCKIIYKPIFTEDGIYRLQIQAKDVAGNISGDNKYVIDFEIITKSTITNLLNYPNPFSSQTRFVFELTGSEIPDEMLIEIFTVSGKIVKRIYLEELGPITIGKNITEYAWDGCDTYGDRLANGVYFYTVKAKINGEDIEKRNVGTDKYFKKEVGKMYILR